MVNILNCNWKSDQKDVIIVPILPVCDAAQLAPVTILMVELYWLLIMNVSVVKHVLLPVLMMRVLFIPKVMLTNVHFVFTVLKKVKTLPVSSVCPTHAMIFGDLDDKNSEISKALRSRKYKTLIPEAGTKPHVYYLL